MGLKLFFRKGQRLRKTQAALPSPEGPPPLYSAGDCHGSQSPNLPNTRHVLDEQISLDSALMVEPSALVNYDVPPPRYTALVPSERASGQQSHEPRGLRTPRATRSTQVRLPGPLYPDEPSFFLVPAYLSPVERTISSIPLHIWARIVELSRPADAANLAFASKTLRYRLGSEPWKALNRPENKESRIEVLLLWDKEYPDQLLCFPCGKYHFRLKPGKEKLQTPNSLVTNPIYDCPLATESISSKTRLTHDRILPFSLVQLAARAERFTPEHGIPYNNLSKRWRCKESDWSHATRVYFHNGHLLLRTTSTRFAAPNLTPSEERLLLYSRTDYAPYFGVCEHWHKGDLMRYCKCALSHIPEPSQSIIKQLKKAPGVSLSKLHVNQFPKQCEECKPIRRCPYCPTEYLIEIKLVEDKQDPVRRFKHAICVTRWSDFGDCKAPSGIEWASCNGEGKMNSFALIKNPTLSTTFETAVSNCAPTPKVMPLKRGGHVY